MEGDEVASGGGGERKASSAGVFLALGSNVGSRQGHLAHAVRRLGERYQIEDVSSVYETDAEGFEEQGPFLNAVVRLSAPGDPLQLLESALEIERERGRTRTFRNAPRTLDIDLLLFGDERVERDGLVVPHPRMTERAFVLVPLLELVPRLVEPGTGRPYAEYLSDLGWESGVAGANDAVDRPVRRVMDYEELLDGT